MSRSLTIPMIAQLLAASAAAAQTPQYELDTLHVEVGSRVSDALPVATRGVEVLTAAEIRSIPARNVAGLLEWALGVDVRTRSPAQADLALRGGTFEQVLVLVDGVRVSDVQTGHFDLDLAVPLAAIQRIEILRGPASALYGADAMGGVVNIVTRRGDAGTHARLEGGSFGTLGLGAGTYLGGEEVGARIDGEFRRSDGHRDGTGYRIAKARASAHAPLAGRTLRASLAFAARDFGARAFYTPPGAPYDEFEETRTATASLVWRAPADERFTLEPRLSARRHYDDFVLRRDDPSFYRNVHTSWQLGGQLVGRYTASPTLSLAFGAEAYKDLLESTSLGDRDETRAAVFAEAAAGRAGHALLTAGLRADWYSEYGGFLAPSLAGAFWPIRELRLRASVGRAFRAPSWTERFYDGPVNKGNPDLQPERSWSAELGADYSPGGDVRVGIAGFVRHARDLIDWARRTSAPSDAPFLALNIEEATFRGLEAEATIAGLLGARWTLRASALSFEAEEGEGYTSRYALRPLTQTVSIAVRRPLPGGFAVSLRAERARRAGEQPYLRADARLSFRGGDARVYLDLVNITDADYLDASHLPVAGRAAYVGIVWHGGW